MKVIGMAGHIDHGKSTLVRRLTGIDPDRLVEEKLRGMTIDLGFAWFTLPSGTEASIVDVPGHERFVKNMVAGAAGIDVAVLVVAADEGVMPQTREHLDILGLLGVTRGVVAVTKIDLVEEEWLELALVEIAEALHGTALQESPLVPVSSTSGKGIDALLAALDDLMKAARPSGRVRVPYLPIDRAFTISGFGTVVTGSLQGGRLSAGDEVEILPNGKRGRIRSLQTNQRQVTEARSVSRVAVNLSSVPVAGIHRGDVLVLPGAVRPVRRFDTLLRVLESSPVPLAHGMKVSLHAGTAERLAGVSILNEPSLEAGSSGWVQIRVDESLVVVPGQRFILRLPAPVRTVAGGRVVDIEPRHRRSDPAALDRLAAMDTANLDDFIRAALSDDVPRDVRRIAQLSGCSPEDAKAALLSLENSGAVTNLGSSYVSAAGWTDLQLDVRKALDQFHDAHPLAPGMSKEELRSRARIRSAGWPKVLRLLLTANLIEEDSSMVFQPGRRGGTAGRKTEVEAITAVLRAARFSPPRSSELIAQAGGDDALLLAMAAEGVIIYAGDDLYFDAETYREMVGRTLEIIGQNGSVSVGDLRDSLGSSRKYVLAFLEHLDAERLTRRSGDVRVLGSRPAPCG
ncbi:MAG: selenocysteine-specific translation elongation factor [Chloroflexota bacterium]